MKSYRERNIKSKCNAEVYSYRTKHFERCNKIPLATVHDAPQAGLPGRDKILAMARKRFY